jgi:hypothetical protein
MAVSQATLQRSQLGRLLVARKVITQAQLDYGIQLQLASGKRLGEIIVEQGWASQKQIDRALRKQSNIRMVAVLVATLLSPFQLARASDLAPAGGDLYNSTQMALINNFQAQSLLSINSNNPDLGNVANLKQNNGEANLAIILQTGNHNVSSIDQSGGVQNIAMIRQEGSGQIAGITQTGGHGNAALISQR